MIRTDIPVMAKQLSLLAEVFDKRALTDGAVLVWFDTLKEFAVEKVTGILIGWPKGHGKFPTPAEVWRACNDASTEDRERKAAVERAENKSAEPNWSNSAAGNAALKKMREILARPKTNMKEHYRAMRDNPESSHFQVSFAKEALHNLGERDEVSTEAPPMTRIPLPEERVPGSDDDLPAGMSLDDLERKFADMANP